MAQVPLAGRGVVGAVGGIERGAAFGKTPGGHHFGKLRLYAVGGNGQHPLGIAPYRLNPAVCGQVVLRVAHAQGGLAQLRAVAGGHAIQIGLRKLMHAARIVGMAARAKNLNALGQRCCASSGGGRSKRGGSGRHGPMVVPAPSFPPMTRITYCRHKKSPLHRASGPWGLRVEEAINCCRRPPAPGAAHTGGRQIAPGAKHAQCGAHGRR